MRIAGAIGSRGKLRDVRAAASDCVALKVLNTLISRSDSKKQQLVASDPDALQSLVATAEAALWNGDRAGPRLSLWQDNALLEHCSSTFSVLARLGAALGRSEAGPPSSPRWVVAQTRLGLLITRVLRLSPAASEPF